MNPSPSLWSAEQPPRLLSSRNVQTGALRFPRFDAGSPLAPTHEQEPLPSTGHLYSFTVIHPNPKTGEPPFTLGYVDLPGPVRIFGRICGEAIRVGARCQAVPDAQYGYAFQTLPS